MDNPYDQFVEEPAADENPYAQFVARPSADENPYAQFVEHDPEEASQGGVAARGLARGAAPAVGGLAAGLYAGAGAAAYAAPLGPIASGVAGIGTGLAVGLGAGHLISAGQEKLMEALGMRDEGPFSHEQEAADEALWPKTKFAAEALPSAALLKPTGSMAARGLGAGIGGLAAAGEQLLSDQPFDWGKVATGAAIGGAFPTANKAGQAIENAGIRKFGRPVPPVAAPTPLETAANEPGQNLIPQGARMWEMPPGPPKQGDLVPQGNRTWDTGADTTREITPPQEQVNKDLEFARAQRDILSPDDPLFPHWNDYVGQLEAKEAGKGIVDIDASQGPHSDVNAFTYHDTDLANDLTTVALGVAAENPRAPRIKGAGNPVGAPMEAREASGPNSPKRDWRKLAPKDEAPISDMETVAVSEAPIHEDIAAALAAESPPKPAEPEPVARPEPREPPAEVTAAVTPEDAAAVAKAREHLEGAAKASPEEHGKYLDYFNSRSPAEQAEAAHRVNKLVDDAQDRARRPTLETGVQVRGPSDMERKGGSLKAIDAAVEKFPRGDKERDIPTSAADKKVLVDRLRSMVQHANELFGGRNPLDPKVGGYAPKDKTPGWKLLKAAADVIKKPTPANIQKLRTAEEAIVSNDAELAQANKVEDRITADVEKGVHIPEAAGEALINQARVEEPQGRPEYRAIENPRSSDQEHVNLVEWLDSLSDQAHGRLADKHDIATDVATTRDPEAVLQEYKNDLTRSRQPQVLEDTTDMSALVEPPAPKEKVVTAEPYKRPETAGEGRVIDPNSAEGKAIAASKAGKLTPEELEAYKAKKAGKKVEAPENPKLAEALAREAEGLQDRPAIEGSEQSAMEHWAKFLGDEQGAVPMPQVFKRMADWMKPREPEALEQGSRIGSWGTMLGTGIARIKANALAAARTALYPDGKLPEPAAMAKMYRAKEDYSLGSLSKKDQDYFNDHVKPALAQEAAAYDELRDISNRLGLPGHADMPERKSNTGIPGATDFMPRRQIRDENDTFDPITNRGLSNWAASAQERGWFTLLEPTTQTRKVYRVNDDGNLVFYNNRVAGRAKAPPSGFEPNEIGSTINVKDAQGNPQSWVVDNSRIDELMQHGAGENGKPLVYSKNPVYNALDSLIGIKEALARAKLLEKILTDPDIAPMFKTKKADAEATFGKGNFSTTVLPQLKGRYMPKPVAWALDDLVKTGFDYGDSTFLNSLSRFTQATLKPFYFFGPEVHVLNELDKYLIGRGVQGVTVDAPAGIKHFADALKSVRTQDATQAEIMDAGGNPMFLHALTSRIRPQLGKILGEDIANRPWKYDPIFKQFGVNSKQVFSELYQGSNKMMWWQSDVLYTALYKEARSKGLSPREAVKDVEKIIDSYQVPTTFGKSVGLEGTEAGRFLQKILTDPITATFGRFHYGLYHMAANIVKNIAGPNSTMADRVRGAGQAAMLGAMATLVYPALSAGYAKVTGNEHSEFERRGLTRLAMTPVDVAQGKKDLDTLSRNLWSPSTVADTAMRTWSNRDFAGRKIVDPSGGWPRALGQAAEFGVGQVASPFKTVSQAATQGDLGWVAQRFGESNFGLKTPSPAGEKYEAQRDKTANRDAKFREKHPRGFLEQMGNEMFKR